MTDDTMIKLLHEIVTGQKEDQTPRCHTVTLACLPTLNDMYGWRDHAHRGAVILEYFPRLLLCKRDAKRDVAIATRLADLAEDFARTAARLGGGWMSAAAAWAAGADADAVAAEANTRAILETICEGTAYDHNRNC